jgi:hypothetical protein
MTAPKRPRNAAKKPSKAALEALRARALLDSLLRDHARLLEVVADRLAARPPLKIRRELEDARTRSLVSMASLIAQGAGERLDGVN